MYTRLQAHFLILSLTLYSRNIQKLELVNEDEQTAEFTDRVTRLQALDERREALRRKLEQYKQLQKMLEPLKNPQDSVQPNLVTRDGPLADELSKSKALGIRVARGLARRSKRSVPESTSNDEDISIVDERDKLATILNAR
jgi:hypothetical protein